MPPRVFDYREDPNGTIVATDQVRAKFLRREPGQELGGFHSHVESNAVETWVILEGAARFDFRDGSVVATAGQAVFSWPDEPHRITCVGDRPVVYFLTVSPHREPTHTHYDADWNQLPTRNSNLKPTWRGEPAAGVDARVDG
jgi:mannose-6-phosphate isomerase-like protein (cupin superfamily)